MTRYQEIETWDADLDDTIPDRINNLAKVIAVGGFHLLAIQEVRSGPKGYFAIKDLQRACVRTMGYTTVFSSPITSARVWYPRPWPFSTDHTKPGTKGSTANASRSLNSPGVTW